MSMETRVVVKIDIIMMLEEVNVALFEINS